MQPSKMIQEKQERSAQKPHWLEFASLVQSLFHHEHRFVQSFHKPRFIIRHILLVIIWNVVEQTEPFAFRSPPAP